MSHSVIPIYRLIALGVLILLLRRLPIVFSLHKLIHQIEEKRQAIFVGFFGPIGVSAIFYLYISIQFLQTITIADGTIRDDAQRLIETMTVAVWFLSICSIVVHGLSIPLAKFGFFLPRTLSRALSSGPSAADDEPQPFHIGQHIHNPLSLLRDRRNRHHGSNSAPISCGASQDRSGSIAESARSQPPSSARQVSRIGGTAVPSQSLPDPAHLSPTLPNRAIRFPDDGRKVGYP